MNGVKALTFDLFGTVLDIAGSLRPAIDTFVKNHGVEISSDKFWEQWRERQRFEQFQDTLLNLGHCGYMTAVRRALKNVFVANGLDCASVEFESLMAAWRELRPFSDTAAAMERLGSRYRLVVLSNGEHDYLRYLVENLRRFHSPKSFRSIPSARLNPTLRCTGARRSILSFGLNSA